MRHIGSVSKAQGIEEMQEELINQIIQLLISIIIFKEAKTEAAE